MDKHPDKQQVKKEADKSREDEKESNATDKVDVAGDDSFPASDPPSFTPIKGEKTPNGSGKRKH